jgi:hypothetical protein
MLRKVVGIVAMIKARYFPYHRIGAAQRLHGGE